MTRYLRNAPVALVALGLIATLPARGAGAVLPSDLYYASATMGATQPGGLSVSSTQWPGVRFNVASPVVVTGVGGHFKDHNQGNQLVFGAIVALTSGSDFPDSNNLSTPDVLRHFLFSAPDTSADFIVEIAPLPLPSGTYGLLFGSNLFGASGSASLPTNAQSALHPQNYFVYQPVNGWQNLFFDPSNNPRFTVYIPEPAAIALTFAAATLLLRRRRAGAVV